MLVFSHSFEEQRVLNNREHLVNYWNSDYDLVIEYLKNSDEPTTLITHDDNLFDRFKNINKDEWNIKPYVLNENVYKDWNPFFWSNKYKDEPKEVSKKLMRADKEFMFSLLQEIVGNDISLRDILVCFERKYNSNIEFYNQFHREFHMKKFYEDILKEIETSKEELFVRNSEFKERYKECGENIRRISIHNTCFSLMRKNEAVKNNHIVIHLEEPLLDNYYYYYLLRHLLLKRSIIAPNSKVAFGMVDFDKNGKVLDLAKHLVDTSRNYGMTYFMKQPITNTKQLNEESPFYLQQYFSIISADNREL